MNKLWHASIERPQDGRWILIFYSTTKTPTLILAHKCVGVLDGAIWAYVQDLLKADLK